ncbi:MAG: glycosyltransferase [bacterium]
MVKKGKCLADYSSIVGEDVISEIMKLAQKVAGKSIKYITTPSIHREVQSTLNCLIPLLNELGIVTSMEIVPYEDEFLDVDKVLNKSLHGEEVEVKDSDLRMFSEYTKKIANTMNFQQDIIIIHDILPIGLVQERNKTFNNWIWCCHIDLSNASNKSWEFIKGFVARYDSAIFSTPCFAPKELTIPQFIIPLAIDPLDDRNKNLSNAKIKQILEKYGIDLEMPIITQIAHFDLTKDPSWAIKIYQLVKRHIDCQLILAVEETEDVKETKELFSSVRETASADSDIHIIFVKDDVEINAIQWASSIILQNSIKERFGLEVTEALWKEKPVVAHAFGRVPLQIYHEVTGILVSSIEGASYYIRYLLTHPDIATRLGYYGHMHIKNNFLLTKYLQDYLLMSISLWYPGENIIYI